MNLAVVRYSYVDVVGCSENYAQYCITTTLYTVNASHTIKVGYD